MSNQTSNSPTDTLSVAEIKSRPILSNRAIFTLTPEEEHESPYDSQFSIDPNSAKSYEKAVLANVEKDPQWGWCIAKLTANFCGIETTDYLSNCSYESEQDFIENSGYYDDMKETWFTELAQQIRDAINQLGLLPYIKP